MSDIFTVSNYRGEMVSCSEERWNVHIFENHPIMKENMDAVKDTIVDPDAVYESNTNPLREVSFKKSLHSSYRCLTKVIVEYGSYNGTTFGKVVTAFPKETETGGIGDVVYRKAKS